MADEQTTQDYYAILEVAPSADEETIRQAYRRLAWRYHPDIAGIQSDEQMRALNAAYQALSDPDRRRAYNASRNLPPPSEVPTHSAPQSTPTALRVGSRTASAGRLKLLYRLEGPAATPVAACAFARGAGVVGIGMIDGQIGLWSLPDAKPLTQLRFGSQTSRSGAGVLHELRLSPTGSLAAAWGFLLGARVWSTANGQALWSTGINAPTGAMDAMLSDTPPLIRLATPDAPLALAAEDPFR
ncbi:MAG: J domain-containing protein, partial [Ktedonobacterales bacterium]